ncbi:type VI secretion protein [Mesorhizobium sp. L-8-10]|uniref:type VI secretion system protein TssA n=1 Tax=Mesorhizobium sp. L-8-10 TaxID=2744523 RepID=UPI00192656AE|nr:type VI secretion system protein TssA [Mesorhizobium sp. L-8-10]BCH33423.1 type VI secretion protein [Mesorhizobium sp. L-8-10]
MIDIPLWLNPLDGENPSGESLRNDPRFHELERLAEPQLTVVRDDRNNPTSQVTVPADWSAVLNKAEELRVQGRDLRLLVLVTRALANMDGLSGLADGLTLIARTFDEHWETMHPELRSGVPPQDAALRRINALLELQNDQAGLLCDLKQTAFFAPRGIGPISGHDLQQGLLDDQTVLNEAASGLNGTEKAALLSAHEQLVKRVRAGCAAHADQAEAEMADLIAGGRRAIAALDAVDAALGAKLGNGKAAVPGLRRFLERMLSTLERGIANRAPPPADAVPAASSPGNGQGDAWHVPPGGTVALSSRLSSREDVIRCLDLVIAFYDRTEPSSPIPHLVRRIRRMVPMDFIELMEDLAPSGLKEFRVLAGVPDSKKLAQKDER